MTSEGVYIDGSVLEGGGQILRMACSLSILMGKPLKLNNIRAGRSSPGLKPQHKTGLELGRDISNGKIWGVSIGSDEIKFHPGKLTGGVYKAYTQTAASIALLIQVALPCALFCPTSMQLDLCGGTNADMAPHIDYVQTVLRRLLEKFGATFDCQVQRRGYFPRGGGKVVLKINPVSKLKAVDLTQRGEITKIWGESFVAGSHQINVASEMGDAATDLLKAEFPSVLIAIKNYKEKQGDAVGNGFGINIFAETSTGCIFGASAAGGRNVSAKQVATAAAQDLLTSLNSEVCVDAHAQDQVIIFMALAEGRSSVRCGPVTLHTKTAIHIAEKLTTPRPLQAYRTSTGHRILEPEVYYVPIEGESRRVSCFEKAKFQIEEFSHGTNFIHCDGIGYQRDVSSPMEV